MGVRYVLKATAKLLLSGPRAVGTDDTPLGGGGESEGIAVEELLQGEYNEPDPDRLDSIKMVYLVNTAPSTTRRLDSLRVRDSEGSRPPGSSCPGRAVSDWNRSRVLCGSPSQILRA